MRVMSSAREALGSAFPFVTAWAQSHLHTASGWSESTFHSGKDLVGSVESDLGRWLEGLISAPPPPNKSFLKRAWLWLVRDPEAILDSPWFEPPALPPQPNGKRTDQLDRVFDLRLPRRRNSATE